MGDGCIIWEQSVCVCKQRQFSLQLVVMASHSIAVNAVETLNHLTCQELLTFIRPTLKVPCAEYHRKASLIDFIIANAPVSVLDELCVQAVEKEERKNEVKEKKREDKKRKHANDTATRCVAQHVKVNDDNKHDIFLKASPQEQVHSCYWVFYNISGQADVLVEICAVCGCEPDLLLTVVGMKKMCQLALCDLPHS